MSDPDFAYNVIRPVAVIGAWLFWYSMGARWRSWLDSRTHRRASSMRNITPGRAECGE